MPRSKHIISAIDLFCGAGGLSYGLSKAGIDVRLGIDIDPDCQFPYTANNHSEFWLRSVKDVEADELKCIFSQSSFRLLAGCAPCQTFSKYNPKGNEHDEKWWLLMEFARLIRGLLPEFITMENVPGLAEQDVFKRFLDVLIKNNYAFSYKVVNCADYGVPQHRNRLVLIASRLGKIELMSPNEFAHPRMTVRNAIGMLPSLRAGECDSNDILHQSAALTSINLKRIQASKQGGTWRDWPPELIAKCHAKTSGKTYGSVYGRMSWDEPAPTITTQFYGYGNGRFGHPADNRALSLREGAILQGFPSDYKFIPDGSHFSRKQVGKLIGNAVPVTIGEVVGGSLYSFINKGVNYG